MPVITGTDALVDETVEEIEGSAIIGSAGKNPSTDPNVRTAAAARILGMPSSALPQPC